MQNPCLNSLSGCPASSLSLWGRVRVGALPQCMLIPMLLTLTVSPPTLSLIMLERGAIELPRLQGRKFLTVLEYGSKFQHRARASERAAC